MTANIESLHARLLNLSRERKMDFQILLNRIGAEQFLFRLSRSPYAEKFIFISGDPSPTGEPPVAEQMA